MIVINEAQQQAVLKARALLIDMECGPLQETVRGPLGSLFDETQFVMDVHGSGNNFAHGHYEYGPKYRASFEEVRMLTPLLFFLTLCFLGHTS